MVSCLESRCEPLGVLCRRGVHVFSEQPGGGGSV